MHSLLVKAGVDIVDVLGVHLLLRKAQPLADTIKVEWIAELLKESAETRVNAGFGAVLYVSFCLEAAMSRSIVSAKARRAKAFRDSP